jgi:MerR family transcriptional regulator, mercuric resistance operon regulatory protein
MRGLSIGGLAQKSGVNLETIRYYERIGLMPEPDRTEGGHRSYEDSDIRRLSFIRRARELGFSLADIEALMALDEGGGAPCAEARSIAATHLENVESKIADLERFRAVLTATVSKCEDEPANGCAVLDVLDGRSLEDTK